MREALARSDLGAVRRSAAPSRGRKPASGASRAAARRVPAPGIGTRLMGLGAALGSGLLAALTFCLGVAFRFGFAQLKRYPVAIPAIASGMACAVAIAINALSLQNGPHPSPLFGEKTPLTAAPAGRTAAIPAAMPPPRPATPAAPTAATASASPAPAPAPATPQPAPATQERSSDPIAQLLATGTPPSRQPETARQNGAQKDNRGPLLAVQKALAGLGLAITPDGMMGPATRKAVAAFEQQKGLPVTGDPATPATRKALSAASGIRLD